MNAYQRIRNGMLEMERYVFSQIRRSNKEGRRWHPRIGTSTVYIYNAIERLMEKGRIRYVRSRAKYGFNSGYVVVKTPVR